MDVRSTSRATLNRFFSLARAALISSNRRRAVRGCPCLGLARRHWRNLPGPRTYILPYTVSFLKLTTWTPPLQGFAATRSFVHSHFLSRLVPSSPSSPFASPTATTDLIPLLKFTNPTRVLSLTLTSAGRQPSSHRLLKESGRLSAHATFVSGVYSGQEKLGEGFGSSIKMSEWRASEDALRRMYLGGRVAGELPSEAWMGDKAREFVGVELGEVEGECALPRDGWSLGALDRSLT